MAGPGGVVSFPKPLSWKEIEAWSNLYHNRLSQWELDTIMAMDVAWLAAKSNKSSGKQHQEIGDYCKGKEIENCRKAFGAQLERVCSTCPE